MKQKKPKDILVKNVLDDLKNIPEDDSVVIGPEGIQGADIDKDDMDATAVLGSEYTGHAENEFLVQPKTTLRTLKTELPEAEVDEKTSLGQPPPPVKHPVRPARPAVKPPPPAAKSKADENLDRTLILGEEEPKETLSPYLNPEMPSNVPPAPESMVIPESDNSETDRTLVANRAANRSAAVEPKVSFGGGKGKASGFEAQFAQAENLKMAQQRILELEKEIDRLRKENELLSSAAEISRLRMDELGSQIQNLERQKHELREVNESELQIFKDGLSAKDAEILRLRNKVDELELRLSNDLRKVRVRERELENRLELSKAEKAALLKAKDESILELKRKTETLESEVESYQNKIIELGQKIESNQEQFARTVRALRLALTNLEVSDGTSPSITLAPLKKAE